MYLLLIGVHAIFFYIAHLLWSVLMQWAFLILLVFFILYFSPLFFTNSDKKKNDSIGVTLPDLNISPKKTILIPLVLTYIGIYILAFTVTRDIGANFNLHLYILLFIFLVFAGYIFAFNWDTVFFRDALRFHLICSYITIFAQLVYFLIFSGDITSIHLIFSIVTLGFSYLFFTYFSDEWVHIFLAFLISLMISLDTILVYFYPSIDIFTLLGITGFIAIIVFEYAPKIHFFNQFIVPSRVLILSMILWISLVLMASPMFSYFQFVWFLPFFSAFLYWVHIRYCNYIGYSMATVLVFFLYTYLFSPLLLSPDLISSLLFIFFFSICIIGNTYFWEERYPYDFSLLHYWSIAFSGFAVLYSLIFVAWASTMTMFLACSLFLMAVLFLLSYFRYQYR